MSNYLWEILSPQIPNTSQDIFTFLSKNRNISVDDLQPTEYIKTHELFKSLIAENVSEAVSKILNAIKNNYPIIIHGDYDVDGQTATAILWRTIHNDLNYKNVFPYIPNRFDEGYGLSTESLSGMQKLLSSQGFSTQNALLITVDCGIVSNKEAVDAKNLGFTVIITDHHYAGESFPECDVLVWTEKATGAGISWLISQALLESKNLDPNKYLDLAALGTVCDLQPLKDFNRAVAKYGIRKLNTDPTLGIKVLKNIAAIATDIDTYHMGWIIGPQLNASGRLENAMDSVRLLATDSEDQALTISKQLSEINKQRQTKTQTDLEFAIGQMDEQIPNFIISSSKNYHEGVIGLVAGKLVQTYYRPALAISIDEKTGMAKGSARSIEGISIIETLKKFGDLFEKVGGHAMAAGFSLKIENIEILKQKLNELSDWAENIFTRKLKIDSVLPAELINIETYTAINKLHPFGIGNSEPVFLTKNLSVFNVSKFGKENQHIKIFLTDNLGNKITGLMFNHSNGYNFIRDDIINVVHSLTLNSWNNQKNIELRIKDIAKLDSGIFSDTIK